MIDLFTKLIEKLIKLARERKQQNRALHDDFIFPLISQFEEVHSTYISSFQEYRLMIVKHAPDFDKSNEIFGRLKDDMIYSHASRKKLEAMFAQLDSVFDSNKRLSDDPIMRFIWSIAGYIHMIRDAAADRNPNKPRRSLLEFLTDLTSSDYVDYDHRGMSKCERAELEIQEKMLEMLDAYSHVQSAYQEAKVKLLK